jgi:general secretion pathway protein M
VKLSKREKSFVGIAACAIAIFLLAELVVFPFFERRDRVRRGLKAKEEALGEMAALAQEYEALREGSRRIEETLAKRKKGFTLFSFVEGAAADTEIKENIKYMKPSESQGSGSYREAMVEIKLEGITLKQLVSYLYLVESPENLISVKRISIKESQDEAGHIDTILQVVTFQTT